MPPTPLTPTLRYYPPGLRKVYWMPTTGNYLAPTRAEMNAGTDLSAEVETMTGWSVTSAMVDVPDMGSRFTSQIPGALTSASNEIVFYTSSSGQDVRGLLPRGVLGYVILLWEGDIPGQHMDVFPVTVSSAATDSTVTDPGKVTIAFAVTKIPANQIIIPS